MRRFFIMSLSLLLLTAPQAFAGEREEQAKAPVHNEYHHSTIYSPQIRETPVDPREGIHVYIDPETGDRVVSVRSRREPETQTQQPFYIEPIVRP
ncbi:MAG: hypothetical protein J5846_01325 [Desulfovibrio sp.]|nr:hypothetical protein [Desulfovibrio sp.]